VITKITKYFFYLSIVMLSCLLGVGCVQHTQGIGQQGDADQETPLKKIYKGKVKEKSKSKKIIVLTVRKNNITSSITINYDERTRGIDHATPGKQVALSCIMINGQPHATLIRPEITKFAPGIDEISVEQVRKIINAKAEYLLFDARPKWQYLRSHLPTALSLPACTMEDNIDALPEENKKMLLIFYCGGPSCGMSPQAAAIAARAGYTNIRVMLAGEKGWAAAGYPTYAEDQYITRSNRVLLDLRAARNDAVERIPRSVSVPLDSLEDRLDEMSKKIPIVVYSDSQRDSLSALAELRAEGFSKVSMVEGNFKGWKKRDNPVISGPIITQINWRRKPEKGEVSLPVFFNAMKGRIPAVILDVRNDDEVAQGKLYRAKHIPLNDLARRMNELPRNQKIYIYSAAGARADMACDQLKEHGYDAYYLWAEVNCNKGICDITY